MQDLAALGEKRVLAVGGNGRRHLELIMPVRRRSMTGSERSLQRSGPKHAPRSQRRLPKQLLPGELRGNQWLRRTSGSDSRPLSVVFSGHLRLVEVPAIGTFSDCASIL